MKIMINDQPLNFTLEHERNVGEIADGVSRWLDPAGLVITAGRLGGTGPRSRTLEEREAWQDVPIDGVDEIGFTVEDYHTMQLTHLQTLHRYFALLLNGLEQTEGGAGEGQLAIEQLADLLEGLRSILGRRHAKVYAAHLQELQEWLREATATHGLALDINAVEARIRTLDQLVVDLEVELSDPVGALQVHVGDLRNSREAIDEVAVWLQSGEDRRAMDAVVAFTEHTQRVMRTLATVSRLQGTQAAIAATVATAATASPEADVRIDGKDLRSFYNELNGFLREVTTAFEEVDSVLIGDLLEYEIGPRIDALVAYAAAVADAD